MKPYRLVWTHEVLRIQATDEDFGSWDEMLARQNELQDAGATTYCLRWDGLQYEEVFSKSVFSSATDKEEPGHGGRFNTLEFAVEEDGLFRIGEKWKTTAFYLYPSQAKTLRDFLTYWVRD
jgi:hypothetical protein